MMIDLSLAIFGSNFLLNLGGFFWLLTYIVAINILYKDKTYVIPFLSVAINFSWEILFIITIKQTSLFYFFDTIACFFDLIIFLLTYRYLTKEKSSQTIRISYRFAFLSLWLGSFILIYFLEKENSSYLMRLSGYIDNLIMSYLFILMCEQRKSMKGQSTLLAIFKLLGTGFITIWNCIIASFSGFILSAGVIIFLLDIYYLLLLVRIQKQSCFNLNTFNLVKI